MNILPSCVRCGNAFTFNPRLPKQKYCSACIQESHTCIDCGVTQHRSARGPRCRKCADLNRIGDGKTGKWNCRPEKSIEQIIEEVEAFGLLPEKQYAFGYVMGVMFGDGSVSKQSVRQSHIRSDGTQSPALATVYHIRLQVTSQAFAERFVRQWEILTGRHNKIWISIRTDFSKSTLKGSPKHLSVQLFNFAACHVLLGRYFKHLKYEQDLYELLRFPPEVMRGFIHGMIDSEGYVRAAYTDIANKNATLLDVVALMFEQLGQTATVHTSPSQLITHLRTRTYYYKYDIPVDY